MIPIFNNLQKKYMMQIMCRFTFCFFPPILFFCRLLLTNQPRDNKEGDWPSVLGEGGAQRSPDM